MSEKLKEIFAAGGLRKPQRNATICYDMFSKGKEDGEDLLQG